ncbi:uncharacterized protein MKK02DRAFT_33127 [Dioszegia hungarica]|uniref:Uncharacterized protein n=1 Tax=Dioszegia hungarica TaxID=4972 RepID=A0AA38H7C2_9TREE|nr:uncharacterized protein MKK02DRAFT_33127 [Dioszegia hungarica]KAI9635777.1 hypothetical protein MKK02DRAFT_33127 [Dioszegia hungarica]
MKRLVRLRKDAASDDGESVCEHVGGEYFVRKILPGWRVTNRSSGELSGSTRPQCEYHKLSVESGFSDTAEASILHLADKMGAGGSWPYPEWVSNTISSHADLSIETLEQPAEVKDFLASSAETVGHTREVDQIWDGIVTEHTRWLDEYGLWVSGPKVSCSKDSPPKPEMSVQTTKANEAESAIDDSGDGADGDWNSWSTGIRYVR